MPRPATVEKQLQEAFEALKAEGKVPKLKDVADKAEKKGLVWSKYPTLRDQIKQYAAVHLQIEEKKAAKKKSSSKSLKEKNKKLEEENSRLLSLLEAYINELGDLQNEQKLKGQGVTKLG
jgi:flagellar motility protein MotE (MotC chaperone)